MTDQQERTPTELCVNFCLAPRLRARIAELEAERDAAQEAWSALARATDTERKRNEARIEHLEAALREAWETALNYIGGPCDDPKKNPHVEVWCITHQEKRCTGTADYERALRALTTSTQEDETD